MTASGARTSLTEEWADEPLILSVSRRCDLTDEGELKGTGGGAGAWRLFVGALVFWTVAAVFAGTAAYLAGRSGDAPSTWAASVLPPLIAGAVWVPLTMMIVQAARRHPPAGFGHARAVYPKAAAGHVVASLLVTFVVNAAFLGIGRSTLGSGDVGFGAALFQLGMSNMHLNAGAYWAVVLFTVGLAALRRRSSAALPEDAEKTLTVRTGTSNVRVRVSEIRWIEAAGDYVRLHLADTDHLLSERLKRLEERLDPDRFVRVHRSAIVNVSAVEKLKHVGHGDYDVTLKGGSTVRVSRSRRARLQEVLEAREVM